MNDEAWLALAVALTVAGAGGTWWAFTHRGASTGLKLTALTMLAPAAYLTGTLELAGEIVMATIDWAGGFVFGLTAWIGVGLAGLAALLFGISTKVKDGRRPATGHHEGDAAPKQVRPAKSTKAEAPLDPDLADIEALLKKRGIE